MERRFHSPYRHWISGLFSELGVLLGFVLVLVAIGLVLAWIAG